MIEKYNHFFDLYLEKCKSAYDPKRPYDNLEECIRLCANFREQLIGMIDLIAEMGQIAMEDADREIERIIHEFSSISICNAYIADGEVMVFER